MHTGPPGGAADPRWPRQGPVAHTQAAEPPPAGAVAVAPLLLAVYRALQERGYDPVGQIAQGG